MGSEAVPVGIDAMYVYTPPWFVDNEELARERGKPPEHFTDRVGIRTFSFPLPNEDPTSMAATAAYRLMREFNVSPEDLFRVDVATESNPEASRALVSDVIGALEENDGFGRGSFSHVLGTERKFACVSGVETLLDSSAWAAAGWNSGKKALLLVTDVARYNIKSREEPTQGAAAAALLIGAEPKLLELVPRAYGSGMRHEPRDFSKPDGALVASVDGDRSVAAYLTEMKTAWLNFTKAARATGFAPEGNPVSSRIDRGILHNPNRRMVSLAFASLLMHEWSALPVWDQIKSEIGEPPERGTMAESEYLMSQPYRDYRRRFMGLNAFQRDFARRVESSTVAPHYVGNSYAASVFVGLQSLFETDPEKLAGKIVALCGYGSGSHALIQAAIVPEKHKEVSGRSRLMEQIKARQVVSIGDYEIHHTRYGAVQRGLSNLSGIPEPPSHARPVFVLSSVGKAETPEHGVKSYSLLK